MTATPPASPTTPVGKFSPAEWIGLVAGAAVLLGLLTARAPHELRKPLLLPLLVGGCVGAIAGELARRLKPGHAVPLSAATMAAVAIALATGAFDSHRQLAAHARAHPPEPATDLLGLDDAFRDWLATPPEPGTEAAPDRQQLTEALEIRRQREARRTDEWQRRQTLLGYLQFRIPSAWGRWPPWLAALFWLLEAGLAATLGAALARRLAGATELPATSPPHTFGDQLSQSTTATPSTEEHPPAPCATDTVLNRSEPAPPTPPCDSPLVPTARPAPQHESAPNLAGRVESAPHAAPLPPPDNPFKARPASTSRPAT